MKFERILWIIIVVGILFYFFTRPVQTEIKIEYVEKFDTVSVIDSVDRPVPYKVYIPGETDTIFQYYDVDTLAILADYFAIRHYRDTLIDNESAFLYLHQTVHANMLWDFYYEFRNRRPVGFDVIGLEPTKPIRGLFIGGGGTSTPEGPGIAVGSVFVLNERDLVSYNYDVVNNSHNLSFYRRLTLRR